MQLYAITERRLFPTLQALIDQAVFWARGGVDFVQIREKDLADADLSALAAALADAVREAGRGTRVLLNGAAEMAAATGCDGVHLTAGLPDTAIADARTAMRRGTASVISVSCHSAAEVERARERGADLVLFAPVFEKQAGAKTLPGQGLEALADACRVAGPMPVFALGGVTAENAQDCVDAGAAGIAAIRLFASGGWDSLRRLG